MTPHYDDFDLFQFVEGSSPISREIEAHASSCARCATEIGAHREIIAAMQHDDVWQPSADSTAAPRLEVIADMSRRLADEKLAASALCDEIFTGPASWWGTRLRQTRGIRTAGMVRQMLERIRPLLDSNPLQALQIASLALEIANDLDVAAYPSDFVIGVRAQAWRDHAYALSFVGRYPEALRAADRAEALFRQTPLPEYELARLGLVRAAIYRGTDRIAEAVACARASAATFLTFGDHKRFLSARMTEAALSFQVGAVRDALAAWQTIERDEALDDVTRVLLVHNLGLCYENLGDLSTAAAYLGRALAEFDLLGMETHRVRARWVLGRTLHASGRTAEGMAELRHTWREYEDLGLETDAALVALELCEALLAGGQWAEVPAICRALLDRFTRAGMTSRAVTALSFLREAVALGPVSPTVVRDVRDFLQRIHAEPAQLFAPAPPDRAEG
jgi:tetratricopeptide (TPR) repeat protein